MTTRVDIAGPVAGSEAPSFQPLPGDRPDGLLPQFKTVTDQTNSYKELQAELTRLKQGKGLEGVDPAITAAAAAKPQGLGIEGPDEVAAAAAEAADKATADTDAAKKVAETSGFDLTTYSATFDSTGDVPVEDRAKIIAGLKGVLGANAEQIVNNYIDGQKDRTANNTSLVREAAGGDEAYTNMVTWAASKLSKAEIAVYNQQVNSGNVTAATFAVEGLRSKFERENGRPPEKFGANSFPVGGQGGTGYASAAEMNADMRDPKYKVDQAFRDSVRNRIKLSSY